MQFSPIFRLLRTTLPHQLEVRVLKYFYSGKENKENPTFALSSNQRESLIVSGLSLKCLRILLSHNDSISKNARNLKHILHGFAIVKGEMYW